MAFLASFGNDACLRTVGKIEPKILNCRDVFAKALFSHFSVLVLYSIVDKP